MLDELSGKGWVVAEPPDIDDADSVVAQVSGKKIRGGLLVEQHEDSENGFHYEYRTGPYTLEVKVDYVSGNGQVRVEKASEQSK
jgi:hypothetical protein